MYSKDQQALVDGVVGRKTLAALNVTAKKKAQQLALNITRLEMFEEKDSDAYVLVNIPEFRLRYISKGKVKATKDVVVGKPSWATPSFSCLLYTSPSPRDLSTSRMPSSA